MQTLCHRDTVPLRKRCGLHIQYTHSIHSYNIIYYINYYAKLEGLLSDIIINPTKP